MMARPTGWPAAEPFIVSATAWLARSSWPLPVVSTWVDPTVTLPVSWSWAVLADSVWFTAWTTAADASRVLAVLPASATRPPATTPTTTTTSALTTAHRAVRRCSAEGASHGRRSVAVGDVGPDGAGVDTGGWAGPGGVAGAASGCRCGGYQ